MRPHVEKEEKPSSTRSDVSEAAIALDSDESLDRAGISGHISDTMLSPNESTDEGSSAEESFDFYDGTDDSCSSREWSSGNSSSGGPSSSDTDLLSNSETTKAEVHAIRPAAECHDETQDGMPNEELPNKAELETEEEGICGQERGNDSPEKYHRTTERSRRKRRGRKHKHTGRAEEGNASLDDAWSNRWLTGKWVLT